jgi:hypothetical protein
LPRRQRRHFHHPIALWRPGRLETVAVVSGRRPVISVPREIRRTKAAGRCRAKFR